MLKGESCVLYCTHSCRVGIFFHREIAILRKLRHKNVIRLVDVLEDVEKQKLYPNIIMVHKLVEEIIHCQYLGEKLFSEAISIIQLLLNETLLYLFGNHSNMAYALRP